MSKSSNWRQGSQVVLKPCQKSEAKKENQKSPIGYILEGLGMENFGIFYCHVEFWQPFLKSYGQLVDFVVTPF
jgi:hypothetical protein